MSTVATCRVRCGGHMHRIELDDRGCLHFPDHTRGFSRREEMLVKLGGAGCRCWYVLYMWRVTCQSKFHLELPPNLKDEARTALKKHKRRRQERNDNKQFPTFHGRMGQRAVTLAHEAMMSADYCEGDSAWVENSGECSVDANWSVDHLGGSVTSTVDKVWHEKNKWSAQRVTWNLVIQPARYLMAQHRFGHHVAERGKLRVVLEILPDYHELRKKPLPLDAMLVRAVRQGKGYDVRDCIAMLRSPKAGEKHWRLTRWLD